MPMMIRRESALEALGPDRLAVLRDCVAEAWREYEESVRPILPLCSPVGMANILRELVVEAARSRLTEEDGFSILDGVCGGRFLVQVDGRLVVQFRKLTRDFLTRNNPTDTSDAFDRQEPGIEEIPDMPRLTVGYQLGQYRTSIAGYYLAFVVGNECIWHHDLDTGEHSIVLDFPEFAGESAAEQETAEEERRRAADDDEEEVG